MNCTNSPCHSKNAHLRRQWTLSIQNPSDGSWTTVNHDILASTPLNSPSLVINANTLIPGRRYCLNASIANFVDSCSGFSKWCFATTVIPTGGSCTANPLSGVSLQQYFVFSCTSWEDENQPLLYEFMTTTVQGLVTTLSYGYLPVVEMTLPPGEASKNYFLTVDVFITSTSGSRTKATISLQVRTRKEESVVIMIYFLGACLLKFATDCQF